MTSLLWKFLGGISLRPASSPPNPEEGDLYYDAGLKKLLLYQGTCFQAMMTGTGYVGTSSQSPLTATSNRLQVVNSGGSQALPSSGVKSGDVFTFVNRSSSELVIQSINASEIDRIASGRICVVALQDAPVSNTDWLVTDVYERMVFSSLFTFSISNSGPFPISLVRQGTTVTLYFQTSITKTSMSSGFIVSQSYLPSRFCPPSGGTSMRCYMLDNDAVIDGTVKISHAGDISFFTASSSSFNAGGGATGLSLLFSFSYTTV